MFERGWPARVVPSRLLELNTPFCLGETHHYFNQCDLFHSFRAIVEVQFGGLARLDRAVNNYKDNLNSLYRHTDLLLTVDRVLRNVIVSTYSHYIDTWAMNGACVDHCAVLMRSMLKFAMHFGQYQHRERYNAKECRRKGIPHSIPSPAIDFDTILTDEEENLKLEQISTTHPGILDLLGDSGNPL